MRLVEAALDRAGDEALALLVHLLADLLAHRAAQQIGLAERVAREHLRDLHHLLLVDDHAERLAQDRLELGMDVVGPLGPLLAGAIGRDVRHRPRPVERDERDDVLEPVRPHVDQRAPHAGAFHLEHADRLAARQHRVGLLVIERDAGEIDRDPAPGDQLHREFEHGQRLQPEEVELHETRLLDPFHVELGHGHVRLRIAVERHELAQRPVADDDAGGVRRGVPVESFELLRNREGARDDRLGVARGLQARLAIDRFRQRHRLGRIMRDELAQLVDLPIRHLQHAADVAQDAARLQRAEGDDLRHLVAAVALLHVADHLVAAVLAEVDVEVGHRHALGIEEALEQQAEADRIEIGDGERVGDERARAGAAPRPDRDSLFLRPLNEIGDDEEVAGIFHAGDHAKLEGKPLAVVLFGLPRRYAMGGHPKRKPLLRPHAQRAVFVERPAAFGGKARQDRLRRARPETAALRDLHRRGERLRQIGEQLRHFGAGLEPVFRSEMAALSLREQPALGDAEKRVMRLVVVGAREERLVRGDQRDAARIGLIDECAFGRALRRRFVALQLDIEPAVEQPAQGGESGREQRHLSREDRPVERAVRPAGERNQAFGRVVEPSELHMRRFSRGGFQEGARDQAQEIAVSLLARGQQHETGQSKARIVRPLPRPLIVIGKVDSERAADDRLDSGARELLGKFQRAEHIVGVGERERRLPVGFRQFGKARDRQRALQQRIGRMHVQMHETGIGGHAR